MAIIEVFLVILNTAVAIFVAVIIYYKNCYTFWKNKEVPYQPPTIPLGNSQNPFLRRSSIYEHLKFIYDKMKHQNHKHCGVYTFTNPAYIPIDLEYVKNVMTKEETRTDNENDDPLSVQLASLEGEKWKRLRNKLSPTYTTGKIKTMHPTMIKCAQQMIQALDKMENCPIDIKEILTCYTTDVIGSCAFGLKSNSFKEKESMFRRYGRKIFKPSLPKLVRSLLLLTFSNLSKQLRLFDQDFSDVFLEIVKETVTYREVNKVRRNDFLQILIDLKNTEDGLTIEEIATQAFVFFLAGFETSSTTLTFCLYELAKNPDIQEKLRAEVLEILKRHEEVSHEAISDMKYMNQIIEETLRKYPAVPTINRVCTKEYNLPGSASTLEKGVRVLIPIFAIHRDPEIYLKPDQFDPDRFSEENKPKIHPFAYLPFGEGPRSCMGMRFGLMQSKIGLALLLKNYKFSLNFNTIEPIIFEKNSFVLTVKDTIWLNAIKLK